MSVMHLGSVTDAPRGAGLPRAEGVTPPRPPALESGIGRAPATAEINFGDLLAGAVKSAAEAGQTADQKADAVARGVLDDLHGTMISAKEAEISMKLVGSVRNKLLDAFHEIWRTSV
jgi:flagellar hook-basal body complex protein FliE